ncbi:TOBE domain-containing protein [Actinomyces mediterranea]|uniref:TOBE domain-containing protein n=1 Tax=Actinomyces mediterranea TaxID=1871028 RepID=UPI002E25EC3F
MRFNDGLLGIRVGEGRLVAAQGDTGGEEGEEMALLFEPDAVALLREPGTGSARSLITGRIDAVESSSGLITAHIALDGERRVSARVTTSAWAELGCRVGNGIWCAVKATQIRAVRVAPR